LKYQVQFSQMPLAVYREVAAHLSQVLGVEVTLLPQQSQQFDYLQSQVSGLQFQYTEQAEASAEAKVNQILAYYSDRYGSGKPIAL
jgi:hypothetical protein